jgi:ACS family glucarate transporter-like MFS transporter
MAKYLPQPFIPTRFFMVAGTFLLAMLVLVDRIAISVAKDDITSSLSLSDKQFGWILSVFALGYALFQAPSGYLADKYGARKVLTAVVFLWSLFTIFTGLASGFVFLLIVRFLFGCGEAGAFPGISKMIYNWIPIKERGAVNGINFSGGRIGAAFSLPIIAVVIDKFGWQATFFILGFIGIIWALSWYFIYRDSPADHPLITEYELNEIGSAENVSKQNIANLPFLELFKSRNVWLLMAQYFASNFTFFFCLTWLFPYLKDLYHLNNVEAGFYSSIPLLAGAVGNIFSGFLVDLLYKKGLFRWSRNIVAIVGFSLSAIGLVTSLYVNNVQMAVLFISIAVLGADMTLSPSWTFCVDIAEQNSGLVSGTMNMAGNIGSFLTALSFPYLRSWTDSDAYFFYLGAIFNVLAIIFWLKLNPLKKLEKVAM